MFQNVSLESTKTLFWHGLRTTEAVYVACAWTFVTDTPLVGRLKGSLRIVLERPVRERETILDDPSREQNRHGARGVYPGPNNGKKIKESDTTPRLGFDRRSTRVG